MVVTPLLLLDTTLPLSTSAAAFSPMLAASMLVFPPPSLPYSSSTSAASVSSTSSPLLHRLFRFHLASVRASGMQDPSRISLPSLGRLFSIATLTSSRFQKHGIGDLMMFPSAELLHLDSPSVIGLDHFLLMFLRRKEVAL